jgi:ubiquinone/menaquinone biosynthesis C-methylase UbiE
MTKHFEEDKMTEAGNREGSGNHGHVCPHRAAFILDNWIRRLFQNPVKIVGEYVKEGDTVIDFGCGPGFFSIPLARLVGEKGKVFAVDLQEEMLAFYMVHETPDPAAFLKEVKTLLKEGGKFLVAEPKMHVNQKKFEEMIEMAKQAGFTVAGFPVKKGGRSVLLTL